MSNCILWDKYINKDGYGIAKNPKTGNMTMAHRVVYEQEVGDIPDGLTIDHLCRNRACVNTKHMEPVTLQENKERGKQRGRFSYMTECVHGHPFTEENTYLYMWEDKQHRQCRTCQRERNRQWKKRNQT